MQNEEYKRLRRLVFRCFLILLFLIVAAVFVGSYKLRSLNTQFASQKIQVIKQTIVQRYQSAPAVNGINGQNGINGSNGLNGSNGTNGTNGTDGQNITASQIAQAVSDYLQANPPLQGIQGQQGIPGAAGRTILLQLNPITGTEECKYLGDLAWQPISECE